MPYRAISYEEELKVCFSINGFVFDASRSSSMNSQLKQRQVESRLQSVAKTLFYDRALHPSIRKLIRNNDVNLCSIRDIERVVSRSTRLEKISFHFFVSVGNE